MGAVSVASVSTISSALWSQTKGRGSSPPVSIQLLIEAASCVVGGDPWLANSASHRSTSFIHQP
jgi:hypothetical protein